MRKIIKYIAEDGKVFDTEYECYDYEMELNKPSSKQLKLIGETMEPLPISTEGIDRSYYMIINDVNALRWVVNISEDYGYSHPTSVGKFYYDTENGEWKDAYCLINKLREIAKALNIKLEDN